MSETNSTLISLLIILFPLPTGMPMVSPQPPKTATVCCNDENDFPQHPQEMNSNDYTALDQMVSVSFWDGSKDSLPVTSEKGSSSEVSFWDGKKISLLETSRVSLKFETALFGGYKYDSELGNLLMSLVERELSGCDILLGVDKGFRDFRVLQRLSTLPNAKQILYLESPKDFSSALWTSSRCRGNILLLLEESYDILLTFANEDPHSWDYEARYVVAGLTLDHLEQFVTSHKGRKTENIVGFVQSRTVQGEWNVYMNLLFWGQKRLQRINNWKDGSFTSHCNFFPDKTSDLKGAQLITTTFAWEPEVIYYMDAKGDLLFRYGLDIETLETVAKMANFTISYQEPPNGEMWGELLENGTWTGGMLGMIAKDETDVAFPLYVTPLFLGILDYTVSYKFQSSCFSVMKEPPLPRWLSLSYPFQSLTWLSILIGFIFSGPVLYLLSWISQRFGDEITSFQSLLGSFQHAIGMHLNEPLCSIPNRPGTRIYILFLWLYCFILTIAYSTNLTAFLTVKKLPKQMDTIKELRDSNNILLALNNYYKGMFLTSPNTDLHAIAENYRVIPDQDEIFNILKKGGYAYAGNDLHLEFIKTTKFSKGGRQTELRVMKECYASHTSAMALQNHSPLRKKFDMVIFGLMSGGLIERFVLNALDMAATSKKQREQEVGKPEKREEGEGSADTGQLVALSLDHMQGIFYILIAAWLLSSVVYVFEIKRY